MEREPFLPIKEDIGDDHVAKPSNGSPFITKLCQRRCTVNLIGHAALIAIYTICSILAIYAMRKPYPRSSAFDNLAFQMSDTIFHNLSQSPFAGPPSPEIDAAWDELLAPMHMRVSLWELRRDNQDSVKLPEGGGYLGWMGVFHELHCIRMLREWNYRSYYHGDISIDERKHLASHIDHCFEMLRQSAVCHADTSLTTFKWHPQKTRPMFNASESIHRCINWEMLMDSAASRMVQEDEILRLENPLINAN